MSKSLSLEESALLAKMKSELDELRAKVEKLENEEDIAEDIESLIEQNVDFVSVRFEENQRIVFDLSDDRIVSIPLRWSWQLENASKSGRRDYRITDEGNKVIWPEVGVEITTQGILTGEPAPRPDEKETKQENH